MKTRSSLFIAIAVILLAGLVALPVFGAKPSPQPSSSPVPSPSSSPLPSSSPGGGLNVTVTNTVIGQTEENVGAVEASSIFDIAKITDLGIKNYRMYFGMERFEVNDDDGVYGSPTIAQIKANPNIIPWAVWDSYFTRDDAYWWCGTGTIAETTYSVKDILTAICGAGVKPVITLRNVENNTPAWVFSNLNPPTTQEAWNEWWEFVFAMVYTINVRYGLTCDDWECLNEPDKGGQLYGWGGTQADYITFMRQTHDAIQYVYDTYLHRPFKLYSPAAAGANTWITNSLINADDVVDVVDWHRYGDPSVNAVTVNGWISQYNSDGIIEPQYLGEWGSYRGAFGTVADALSYANQLRNHSKPGTGYIASSAIFSMFDWSTSCTGLVGANGVPNPPYYSLRLMIRGTQGAKTMYQVTGDTTLQELAAKDPVTGTIYVEFFTGTAGATVNLDLSALGATTGTVTFRQYSATYADVVTGTGTLSAGKVTFTVPKNTIFQVIK
jgi:hypothetical protein